MSSSSSDSDFSTCDDDDVQNLLSEWDAKASAEVSDDDDSSLEAKSDDGKNDEESDDGGAVSVEEVEVYEEVEVTDSEEEASEEEGASEEEDEASEESGEESEASEEASEESEDDDKEEEPALAASSNDAGSDDDDDDVIDDGDIADTLKKKPKKIKQKPKVAPLTEITAEDTEEDKEMKALLGEWGGDDDDDDDSDDEEESDASEREVILNDNVIDHIILAAPDLDEAIEQFEKMTGCKPPAVTVSINGLGIKCSRMSFADSSYIEIIAPDPKRQGPIGQLIQARGIKELTPFHFAVRTRKADDLKSEVKQFGYVPDHITMFGGQKDDGQPRKWELLFLYGHKLGGICPFFINWSTPDMHPCATLPVVGKLKKLTVRAPEDDPLHQLLEHVGVTGINVEVGERKLSFQFSSPEGTVKFATSSAVGYKFPGFEDDDDGLDGMESDDNEDVVFSAPAAPELVAIGDGDYEDLPPPEY